jgi:hypothetical protein
MSTTKQRGKHNDALALQGILLDYTSPGAGQNMSGRRVVPRSRAMALSPPCALLCWR